MSRLTKASNTRLHSTEIDIRYSGIPQEENEAFFGVESILSRSILPASSELKQLPMGYQSQIPKGVLAKTLAFKDVAPSIRE